MEGMEDYEEMGGGRGSIEISNIKNETENM